MDPAPSPSPSPSGSARTATSASHDLHLGQLRPFHEALIASLGALGLGGERMGQILGQDVEGVCAQCGLRVTGAEIAAALAAEDARAAASPKHARLLHHYCARSGCPSYFYRFSFDAAAGVDWPAVLRSVDERLHHRVAAESAEDVLRRRAERRARVVQAGRLGAIVLGLAVLWTVQRWWRTGSLPGFEAPRKYEVDPRSLPPSANRPPP